MTCEEHACAERCGEDCGDCCVIVEKLLPCGHSALMKCASDIMSHKCLKEVTVTLKSCNHTQFKLCHVKEEPKCETRCGFLMKCGHECQIICHTHSSISNEVSFAILIVHQESSI